MGPRRTARLVRQLASALDAIHAREVCHRDVKKENIIVRRAGAADEESVLIDFSIAIVKEANETRAGRSAAGLSRAIQMRAQTAITAKLQKPAASRPRARLPAPQRTII